MKETIYIPIVRYMVVESDERKPVCAVDFEKGEVCTFLRVHNFGTIDVCGANDERLYRDKDGKGYLIPTATCPVWNKP